MKLLPRTLPSLQSEPQPEDPEQQQPKLMRKQLVYGVIAASTILLVVLAFQPKIWLQQA